MDRRTFLGILTGGILAAPHAIEAQQTGRTVVIGYLGNSSPSLESGAVEAFREGLREYGYVEGQNLIMKTSGRGGQHDRCAVLAAELVRLKPDVILTAGPPGHPCGQASNPLKSDRYGTGWRSLGDRLGVEPCKAGR